MKDVDILFDEYAKETGVSKEISQNTYNLEGDDYIAYIQDELKKKDIGQISSNPEGEPIVPETVLEQFSGTPTNQIDKRFQTPLPSLGLATTENPTSTELELGTGQSSLGSESNPTTPISPIVNPISKWDSMTGAEKVNQVDYGNRVIAEYGRVDKINATNKAKYEQSKLDILAGKSNEIEDPLFPINKGNNKNILTNTEDNENTMMQIKSSSIIELGTDKNGNKYYSPSNQPDIQLIYKDGQLQFPERQSIQNENGEWIEQPPLIYGRDFKITPNGFLLDSSWFSDEEKDKYDKTPKKLNLLEPYTFDTRISYDKGLDISGVSSYKSIEDFTNTFKNNANYEQQFKEDGTPEMDGGSPVFKIKTTEGLNKANTQIAEINDSIKRENKLNGLYVEDAFGNEDKRYYDTQLKAELSEGARISKEVYDKQISEFGKQTVDNYGGLMTESEINDERFNRLVNNYKSQGLNQPQAEQSASAKLENDNQVKLNKSREIVNSIMNTAESVANGTERTTNTKYSDDTKFTKSEKDIWKQISTWGSFSEFMEDVGYDMFGKPNGNLDINASTTTLRKRIVDTYMGWEFNRLQENSRSLMDLRGNQAVLNKQIAAKKDDIKSINKARQQFEPIENELKNIQANAQTLSTRKINYDKGFDIDYKKQQEAIKEYEGYQNGDVADVVSVSLKNVANGLVNFVGDVAGGLMIPFALNDRVATYINAYDYTTKNPFNVINQGTVEKYKVYRDGDGNEYEERNGKVFNKDKDGNITYNEGLSYNQSKLKDFKKIDEGSDFSIAGTARMVSNQLPMMAFAEFTAAKATTGLLGKVGTFKYARNAVKVSNFFGKESLVAKNLNLFNTVKDTASAVMWGEMVSKNNFVQGQNAGLTNKQAYWYGLFQDLGTMALLKVSPDAKYFEGYKGASKELFKLISANKWKEAGLVFNSGLKQIAKGVFPEEFQENFEQAYSDITDVLTDHIVKENDSDKNKFDGFKVQTYIDTTRDTGILVGLISARNVTLRGKNIGLNIDGMSKFQQYIVASQFPNVNEYLNEVKSNSWMGFSAEQVDTARAQINKIKKYTDQIPPSSNLEINQTESVVLSMEKIDNYKKAQSQSEIESIKTEYQNRINVENENIARIFNESKNNKTNNTNESTTPTDTQAEGVQDETTGETTTETNNPKPKTPSGQDGVIPNTETDGQTTLQEQEPTIEMRENGQSITEERGNPNVELREVPQSNQESEQVTQANQEEIDQLNNQRKEELDKYSFDGDLLGEQKINERYDSQIDALKQNNKTNQGKVTEVKPIRQLGSGANVYFESEKHRLNENQFGNEPYVLNIGDKDNVFPRANIEFTDLNEAKFVAEKVDKDFPKGMPDAILVDKYIDQAKEEYKNQSAQNQEINEDEIVLADDTLDLINSLTDETTPSDNIGTDGSVEPAISSVQQGGQENNPTPTIEPTTSEGEVEIEDTPELQKDVPLSQDKSEDEYGKSKTTQEDNIEQEPITKVIERTAEDSGGTTTAKLIKAEQRATELIDNATDVKKMSLSKLKTDEGRFQGRKKLNQTIVDNIAKNFSEKDQDPIHIWKDPKDGKYYVLSGHHRYYGAEKAGKKSVKVIDRSADFNEKQAITFAKEEANANRSMETPLERATTLRKKREGGATKIELSEFLDKEGKNKRLVDNLSNLNPKGKTVQSLELFETTSNSDSKRETEKIADWIGEARKLFGDKLTDAHENEMYDFLNNKEASKRFTNKSEFVEKIRNLVGGAFHDSTEPLNLNRIQQKGDGEREYDKQMQELKSQVADYDTKISDLDKRFTDTSRQDYISPDSKDFASLKELARKQKEQFKKEQESTYKKIDALQREKGNYVKADINQGSLFDFQSTDKQFSPITQKAYNALVKKLSGVFKKFGANVITDIKTLQEKLKEFGYEGTSLQNISPLKSRQLAIINKTNPAPNTYNTWVRNEGDILTAEEAFKNAFEDGEMYPDFTVQDMQLSMDEGFTTVYSSKPIKDGNFVTPSKMNAQEYAGGKNGKIYSERVKNTDIAWIDESEGQVARIQFMKNKNGEIYGAKFPDGTIYLNPEKVNANTPIHEFSHLWQQLMPTRFKSGVEILKNTPVGKKTFAELKANEGYANKTDEEIWNEALVTVMGNEGERIFNSPKTSKIKTWLTDFFKKLGDVLGIRKLTPTDNLSVFVKGALSEVMGDKEIFAENISGGNNSIDFSIIGEKGANQISELINSKTLLLALDKARELESEGKSQKDIYDTTGWEKGTDGKWKNELNYDISIKNTNFKKIGNNYETTLSDLIEYHSLFGAYPQLENTKVIISDNKTLGSDTLMSVIGDEIYINKDNYGGITNTGTDNVGQLETQPNLGTILHEVQHLIQGIEGFAQGTNPTRIANLLAEEILGFSNQFSDESERNRVVQIAETIGGKDWKKEFSGKTRTEKIAFGAKIYNQYAGEVEARNAEQRLNFSKEIRNAFSPSETEDISKESQVVISKGLTQSNSQSPQGSVPKFAKPTNLMPKSLITNITNAIRNGGNFNDAMNVAKESNWYKNLGESAKNNFDLNALKQTMVDSYNYQKESAEIKVAENKVKAKEKLQETKEKSEAKLQEVKQKVSDNLEAVKSVKEVIEQTIKDASENGLFKTITSGKVLEGALKALNRAVTPSQQKNVLNRVKKIILDNDYSIKLRNARTEFTKIKKALSSKRFSKSVVNKSIVQDFLKLNPNAVSDINEYNDIASKIKTNLSGIKIDKNIESQNADYEISNKQIEKYVSKEIELANKQKENDIIDDYNELSLTGTLPVENMTLEEYKDMLSNDVKESTALTADQRKEVAKQKLDYMKSIVKAKTKYDLKEHIALVSDSLSAQEKKILGNIQKINIDKLRIEQVVKLNDVINNFVTNNDVTDAGFISLVGEVDANMSLFDKTKSLLPNNFLRISKAGDILLNFASNDQFFDFIAGNTKMASLIKLYTGVTDLMNGNAKTKLNVSKTYKEYTSLKESMGDNIDSSYNRIKRGIYADVIKNFGGSIEERQEEFERRKGLVKANYEAMLKDGSIDKQYNSNILEEANNIKDIYDNLLEGSETVDEFIDKFKKEKEGENNIKLIDYWIDKHLSYKDDFFSQARLFNNKDLSETDLVNYTATRHKKIGSSDYSQDYDSEANKNMFDSVYSSKNIVLEASGSKNNIVKYSLPPKGKVMNYDFDVVQMEVLHENLYDLNTSEAIAKLKIFFENRNENIERLGGQRNFEIMKKQMKQTILAQKNQLPFQDNTFAKFIDKVGGLLSQNAARLALGSVTQIPKQYVSVATNTLINLGTDADLFIVAKQIESEYGNRLDDFWASLNIGLRGSTKAGFSIDTKHESDKAKDKKTTGEKINEINKKLNEKVLTPLEYSDVSVARTSYLAYYMKDLRSRGIDIKNIKWEEQAQDYDREADSYAEQMVSISQNINDASSAGAIFKSTETATKILKNIVFPYASFAINQRFRMTNDVLKLTYGSKEVKQKASRDLVASLSEQFVFNGIKQVLRGAVNLAAGYALIALGFRDDDDEPEFIDKYFYKNIATGTTSDFFFSGMSGFTQKQLQNVTDIITKLTIREEYFHEFDNNESQSGVPKSWEFINGLGVYSSYFGKLFQTYNDGKNLIVPYESYKGIKDKKEVYEPFIKPKELNALNSYLFIADVFALSGLSEQAVSKFNNKLRSGREKYKKDRLGSTYYIEAKSKAKNSTPEDRKTSRYIDDLVEKRLNGLQPDDIGKLISEYTNDPNKKNKIIKDYNKRLKLKKEQKNK